MNPALKRIFPLRPFKADLVVMLCTKKGFVTPLSGRANREQAENAVLMYVHPTLPASWLLTIGPRFLEELDRRMKSSESQQSGTRGTRAVVPEYVC